MAENGRESTNEEVKPNCIAGSILSKCSFFGLNWLTQSFMLHNNNNFQLRKIENKRFLHVLSQKAEADN